MIKIKLFDYIYFKNALSFLNSAINNPQEQSQKILG
ncbi:hypothetical protein L932_03155 [Helicobacter pylori PZ5026]|nr:hypothetical protein L932_03155 [Helicobacter pylori PZ5026]